MIVLVTGAAGFIGAHLCRRLLGEGHEVIGVDNYADFYPRWIKEGNIAPLLRSKKFKFIARDLAELSLRKLLKTVDTVFHLAAQAGVRASWGTHFSVYLKNNVQSTQKLLEAAKDASLSRLIYASSSSVYGLTPDLPMTETSRLYPLSPYGVTKLAAEQLCFLYHKNYGVPTVALRFFTVYGPGQRPDMAFHKFFKAILGGREIAVYGDGRQTRDFTYVDDIVEANLAALKKAKIGQVYNVGGGHREELARLFPLFEAICGKPVRIRWLERQKGDVLHTWAYIDKARKELGFRPRTDIRTGLQREWEWILKLYSAPKKALSRKG
jgi:UDP-glucose 4-epimerase